MDWKQRLEHYKEYGQSASMRNEDSAARAIVGGLCGNSSKTHLLATRLGVFNEDMTEFELAKAILDSVSNGSFHPASPARRFMIDVRSASGKKCWKDDDELEELCELATTIPDGIISLGNVNIGSGKHSCQAFMFLRDAETPKPYVLRPVSVLLAKCNGIAVWRREAKQLFKDMKECLRWEVPGVGS